MQRKKISYFHVVKFSKFISSSHLSSTCKAFVNSQDLEKLLNNSGAVAIIFVVHFQHVFEHILFAQQTKKIGLESVHWTGKSKSGKFTSSADIPHTQIHIL